MFLKNFLEVPPLSHIPVSPEPTPVGFLPNEATETLCWAHQ